MNTALSILLVLVSVLYIPVYPEEFETPKTFALIAFASCTFLLINFRSLKYDRIFIALCAFVASMGISSYFSLAPKVSVFGNPKCNNGLLVWLSLLVIYAHAQRSFTKTSQKVRFVQLMVLMAFIVSTYAILQVAGIDWRQWTKTVNEYGYIRPISFLGQPIFMASYLTLILPFAQWRAIRTHNRFEKLFCIATIVTSAAAIVFSGSRGVWLSALTGLVVYEYLQGINLKKLSVYALGILSICMASLVFMPTFRASFFDRVSNIVNLDYARTEYQIAALRIWKKYPVVGIGTDAYELGFQHQRSAEYWKKQPYGSPHRAHNEYLNVLATQGLLGFLCLGLLIMGVFIRASNTHTLLSVPIKSALASFAVQELSCFHVSSTIFIFIMLLAFLKRRTSW